jgi:hypothetical protein
VLEQAIVFAIVACAAGYAGWKLAPRAWRTRLVSITLHTAQRLGALSVAKAATLQRQLAGGDSSLCGSCGGCVSKCASVTKDRKGSAGSAPFR